MRIGLQAVLQIILDLALNKGLKEIWLRAVNAQSTVRHVLVSVKKRNRKNAVVGLVFRTFWIRLRQHTNAKRFFALNSSATEHRSLCISLRHWALILGRMGELIPCNYY